MYAKTKISVLLVTFLFLISSCSTKNDRNSNDLPGITISVEEMNTAFVIEDDPITANSHENNKRLSLVIRNLSDKTIVFPSDYGLRIFEFQDQMWNIVQNRMGYAESEKVLLPYDVFPPGLTAVAYPNIPGLLEPARIRIVMVGHYENSDSEVVGAYIDITLK
jgi:hypothetical protein